MATIPHCKSGLFKNYFLSLEEEERFLFFIDCSVSVHSVAHNSKCKESETHFTLSRNACFRLGVWLSFYYISSTHQSYTNAEYKMF